jgi:hypothetical protein
MDPHGKSEFLGVEGACCGDVVGAKAQVVNGHLDMMGFWVGWGREENRLI